MFQTDPTLFPNSTQQSLNNVLYSLFGKYLKALIFNLPKSYDLKKYITRKAILKIAKHNLVLNENFIKQ
jgi:hypothetical protein